MPFLVPFIVAATVVLDKVNTLEHIQRTITCHDIQTPGGFRFPLGCPAAHEISVLLNKKTIAIAEPGKSNHSSEVTSIDADAIVTKECNDIEIHCLIGGQPVKASRLIYKTERKKRETWIPHSTDRNISCLNITTQGGFKFPLECPVGHEITVYRNKTAIATVLPGKNPVKLPKVLSIDDHSIIMKECIDIRIHCFNWGEPVHESWLNYKTVKTNNIDPGGTAESWTTSSLVGVGVGVGWIVVGIIVAVVFLCLYISWKRKMIKKQPGAATLSGFLRHLLTRFRSRASGPRDVERGDRGSAANTEMGIEGIQLQQVVHTDRERNAAPEGPSCYQAMNRNLRGDPGGVNDKENDDARTEEINSECSPRDCGSATPKAEETPLLSDQRVDVQGSDMTGETADPMAATELDTCVESVIELKN